MGDDGGGPSNSTEIEILEEFVEEEEYEEEVEEAGPVEKPPKKKNPARRLKLLSRKGKVERVVKCALLKHLQGTNVQKEAARNAMRDRVMAFSKRMRMASIALATLIKECAAGVGNVNAIAFPDLFQQTFIRQLLLGTKTAVKKDAFLVTFQARHPELFLSLKRHSGDRNIYSAGATSYLTNLRNHMKMNLIPKLKKFKKQLGETHALTRHQTNKVLYLIAGWTMPAQLAAVQLPTHVCDIVREHQDILAAPGGLTDHWIDDNTNCPTILRYFIHLNRFRATHELPLFSIIPITHVKAHHITIDTYSLYGIMKDLKLISCDEDTFIEMQTAQWASFFNYQSLATSVRTFTGTIETDGVAVSCHFLRPRVPGKKATYDKKIDGPKRQVAFDPGRNPNILLGVELLANGKYKVWKLTRSQYYRDSGINQAKENTELWQADMASILVELSTVSDKGADLEQHNQFVAMYLKHQDALWVEYTKPKWSRQRFELHGSKKRVMDRFFEKIRKFDTTREVVVAYGSAKFASGGRGEISVPTAATFKACARHFKTIPTDEYRSTYVDHATDTILKTVGRRDTRKNVHDLLWCGSTSKKGKFVSRDFNAAINILRCINPRTRPLSLQRQPDVAPIDKAILKWIKC